MAATEELALAVAIEGFAQFMRQMGQMDKSIDGTGGAWTKLGGFAGKAAGVLGTIVVAGATTAAAAIGGAALVIGKLAIAAAPLEGIGIAFDSMASRAGLSLDDLRTASRGTISDFEMMRTANIALTGAGEDLGQAFGRDLPKLLEIAQAASIATGQDVGFLFNSLVTGVKRSSPLLIDNTGLVLKVGEANQTMADSLGITVEELTAEQKQIALLNATVAAGADMIDQFGGGQLTAAERMAQFRATIQNTKDQIGLAFLPALEAIMVPLGELATDIGPKVTEWAKVAGEWLGENLPIAIETLGTLWNETWPGIRDMLLEVWEQVEPVLLAIGEWLRDEGPAALTSAGESFQGFRDVLTEVWTFIQELVEKVVVWFQENLPLITEQAEMVATHFQENLLLMQEAGQALANFWEYVIVPALDNVWEIIKTIVSTALDVILNFITFSMQVMQGDWEGAWTTVKDTASTIWEAIQTIISEFIEGVANAVGTTTEEIKETWETNWEMVKTIVTTIWGNMVTAITEKLNEIVGVVSTKIESVKTTIEGYVGTFSSVGASLMEGLKSGIISKVQSIIDAVKKAVQDAIQAAKDALDWGSPSKVFAELGRSTMEGMALGVAQLAPVVQQQITAAITPVARPGGVVEGAHTEITDNRQFNLNTTTTMRPGGLAMEFTRFEMASR